MGEYRFALVANLPRYWPPAEGAVQRGGSRVRPSDGG
jgi:hypothetical protein